MTTTFNNSFWFEALDLTYLFVPFQSFENDLEKVILKRKHGKILFFFIRFFMAK